MAHAAGGGEGAQGKRLGKNVVRPGRTGVHRYDPTRMPSGWRYYGVKKLMILTASMIGFGSRRPWDQLGLPFNHLR
jgi:hypothetical protein